MNILTLTCPLCTWSTIQQVESDDALVVAEHMADALLLHIQAHRSQHRDESTRLLFDALPDRGGSQN